MKNFSNWNDIPLFFDIPIASALLGKCQETIKGMCRNKKIPAFKIGKEWRFDKNEFKEWIQSQHN